ncbi:IS110 family transposase [Salinibacter ruber]|uniref:IS110 family transposase n=1 Tax=Salinibacter ruber TaxID=146919 RepID=UPI0021687AEF
MDTIPGIGLQTATIVAGELRSPEKFESARQAAVLLETFCAGLVSRHRKSGSSI